jgi:hypothetical protein
MSPRHKKEKPETINKESGARKELEQPLRCLMVGPPLQAVGPLEYRIDLMACGEEASDQARVLFTSD